MKRLPQGLLELVKETAPPEAEIISLSSAYEDEDYTIAVVVPDTIDRVSIQHLQERLAEATMDYDDTHGTFTVCMVWREQDTARAGVR